MLGEAHPQFGCRVAPLESERGFRLIGELDLYNVQEVRETLIAEARGALVLDLAGLTYMDDDGLGLLIGLFKRLRRQGGSLVIRNPRSEITRLFDITGISQIPDLRLEGACSTE
jgi:anti-anti-sigma factor